MGVVRAVWKVLRSRGLRWGVMGVLLLLQGVSLLLPQFPAQDATAYARRLALLQQQYGPVVRTATSLGLFSLLSSWWMRLPLALLLLIAFIRLGEGREVRRWLFLGGALLLAAGWGLDLRLCSWAVDGLIAAPDAPIEVVGEEGHPALHLAPLRDAPPLALRYPYLLRREGWAWNVSASALDADGEALTLRVSSRDEPKTEVSLVLDSDSWEGYFALPQEALIFRLTITQTVASAPIAVQLYDSASGSLLTEMTMGEGETHLFARRANVTLIARQRPVYHLRCDKGLPLIVLGWLVLLYAEAGRSGESKGGEG